MVKHENCWIVRQTMVMIVIMTVAHHTSADLATLMQLTATSVIERPERAALEPPTVTSLKPPERSKSNRGVGISVQGEHSGGHIPPVVASRSPSSTSFSRNYNSRYIHHNPRSNQPAAPVATASSGSRSDHLGKIDGRRNTPDIHHVVPIPTPHLVNGTSVSIPLDSSWVPPVSFAPLPPPPPRNTHIPSGYAPIAGSYPRHSRIPVESETLKPKHQDRNHEDPSLSIVEGGVWGKSDSSSEEGMWQDTRRRPVYPQDHLRPLKHSYIEHSLRSDTFGHQISEDLSHLSNEYSPRRGNSRRGHLQPPGENQDIFHPLKNRHPTGRNVHKIDNYHHLNADDTLELGTEDKSDQKEPTESGVSAPTSIGHNIQRETLQKSSKHPTLNAANTNRGDTHKPLTLYEVWHMVNMSNWEEFVDFLKRKGLNMSQVLNNINEGSTKQDFLKLFAKPDVSSINEASSSSTSDVHQTDTEESDTLHGESFLQSATDSGQFLRTTTFRKVQEEFDVDSDDEDEEHVDENNSRATKEKRKNRRKGKNKKNKGRNGEKNKRKRGRSHDKPVVPDFTYTTVIFPIDNIQNNDTESSKVESFATDFPTTPLLQGQSTQSVPTGGSTKLTLPEYSFDWDVSTETQSTVPVIATWPQSSIVSPTSPMKAILPPTAIKPITPTYVEDFSPIYRGLEPDKASKTTSLPRFKGPISGSLTLPPTSKPSDVSIVSFTVMEAPFQAVPKETALEDIKPLKREKNRRIQTKTTEESFPKLTYSSTKLLPTMTSSKMNDEPVIITPFMREESKDKYTFPVKGFMIITGIMGALAVFTLVVLISYAIIKCSKQPVVNNYQVSEQKTSATQQS